jgi:hypothetical protein
MVLNKNHSSINRHFLEKQNNLEAVETKLICGIGEKKIAMIVFFIFFYFFFSNDFNVTGVNGRASATQSYLSKISHQRIFLTL